jgi:TPR repeat protein
MTMTNSRRWGMIVLCLLGVAAVVVVAIYFQGGLGTPTPAGGQSSKPAPDLAAIKTRALAGDHEAELQMGVLGIENASRKDDFRQAGEWLQKAAEAGNLEAQYRLGTLYQSGQVPDSGNTNAVFWFEKAAARNHPGALFNLGSMYGTGQGVARDQAAALKYFRQAAELGDAYAQFNLGRRYAEAQGTATNLVEAWQWFTLAEGGGVASAHERKVAVEARLSATELERARQGAEEVRKKAARGNN